MRKLREDVIDTLLVVLDFDGKNRHKDVRKLEELGEFPISGDALALITQKEPK